MTLKGKDETDLEKQLRDWRSDHIVTTKHPIEQLILEMKDPVGKFGKSQARDSVSMPIEYNEAGD